eukprot:sb/3471750/
MRADRSTTLSDQEALLKTETDALYTFVSGQFARANDLPEILPCPCYSSPRECPDFNMPTSSTFNAAKKCKTCQQNFKEIWLPNKDCCMRERLEETVSPDFFEKKARREVKMSFNVRHLHSFVTHNTESPFSTLQKPTCGSNFSPETNHKKYKHGVLPADLSKWQNKNLQLSSVRKSTK